MPSFTSRFAHRTFVVLVFACVSFAVPKQSSVIANSAATSGLRSFLDQHCFDCHFGESAEAGLDLEQLSAGGDFVKNLPAWIQVHDKIQTGEMPPEDMPQPDESAVNATLGTLSDNLRRITERQQDREGRVRFRRLNRVEYENTLRDLLALPRLEVKEILPPDAEAHGFDNVGEALRISYVQMRRYLRAAEKALSEAAWLAPEIESYQFRKQFTDIHRFRITKDRVTIGDEAVLLRQPNTAQTPWRIDGVEIPFPGRHVIRIRGRAATYDQVEGREMGEGELLPPKHPQIVSVYQGTRLLGSFDLKVKPNTNELTVWLDPQEKLFLHVPTMSDWGPKWKKGAYRGPAVVLDWIEFEGPLDDRWPRPSYKLLFDDLPVELWTEESQTLPPAEMGEPKHPKHDPHLDFPNRRNRYMVVSDQPLKDARRLLLRFMNKAFRYPVPESEVERYLDLVKVELEKRKPFHGALLTGYSAILTSPDFLFFFERPGELDDHALANRLSYFLWRSMPDETLSDLADAGALREGDELRRQVERMLDDAKFERFVDDFTDQWLDLREIRATQPDEKLYPEFDDFLLESMVAETRAYFREMVQQNLSCRYLIDSDFVFANEVLADLYRLDGVSGVEIQKVELSAESPRGGLLTQASVLKVTANGTTTSPVLRGAWVLDRLLGTPAPPPPPNVPAIEPDTRGATTIRDLLAKHRADPACASCHAKIDPPGFALESFDVIGGWRTRYRSLDIGDEVDRLVDSRPVNYKAGLAVDASGALESGEQFADVNEFRNLLLKDQRQVVRNLLRRLIVFATGAGISFADRAEVESILDRTEPAGFPLRDLIHEVVQSETFQKK